ncbi:hypothetical protein EH228_09690 [Erwinia endophytica]|uniref:hypothetical protein n=1 Tax=Erwinia endophytica TaxID=1563158 RepID=UPI001265F3B4|nr:hypothetical protein [Erwinia endophytica]KAB8311653.1 hypothetical protein EH228_09690 [Erwinia endophytica]
MTIRKLPLLIALYLIGVCANSYAEMCTEKSCGGLPLPASAQQFIANGYSKIDIATLVNGKYLFLSSESDVNKCSVIFKIEAGKIENRPSAGQDGKLCNISETESSVVSSRRDQGIWYNDVYQVAPGKPWVLLFTDSCADCQQVKRIYFTNGIESRKELLSEGEKISSRKILNGVISIQKSFLYSQPDNKKKTKAYLIKGDTFTLTDMSDDGEFYQINYKPSTGKNVSRWIKSDDFDLN